MIEANSARFAQKKNLSQRKKYMGILGRKSRFGQQIGKKFLATVTER